MWLLLYLAVGGTIFTVLYVLEHRNDIPDGTTDDSRDPDIARVMDNY